MTIMDGDVLMAMSRIDDLLREKPPYYQKRKFWLKLREEITLHIAKSYPMELADRSHD